MRLCSSKDVGQRRWMWVLPCSFLLLVGAVSLLCLVPPVSRDALVHHLNLPKLYLQYGEMVEFPSMPFSYFPMNLDLLFMIPLWLGNDIAPKFIHFGFALLTAWLIHGYLKPRLGRPYAWLGALFFLSIPIIVKLSITVYVDLGLVFFSTAALLLLFRWVEAGFRWPLLAASAVCCGLAMGTKYNGLVVCFLLTAFVPCLYSAMQKRGGRLFWKPIGLGILYLALALAVFSPWMIRNWQLKQNPVYPLYNRVFHPPKAPAAAKTNHREPRTPKGIFAFRSIVYGESEWQMLLLPVRIFFEGRDGDAQHFDGKLTPFLLGLAILGLMGGGAVSARREVAGADQSGAAAWQTRQKWMLLAFCVLYFLFALFSRVLRMRYLVPMVPPLVILSVFGMKNGMDMLAGVLLRERRCLANIAGAAVLAVCFGLNLHYLWAQFRVVDPLAYLSGRISREDYITRYRPEYPVMRYANTHLPADARVLFVFMGKRGYYLDRPYRLDGAGRASLLMRTVLRSHTPEEIAAGLHAAGITHMMLQTDIFNRWVAEDFEGEKQALFKSFLGRYTQLLHTHHVFALVALSPGGSAGSG